MNYTELQLTVGLALAYIEKGYTLQAKQMLRLAINDHVINQGQADYFIQEGSLSLKDLRAFKEKDSEMAWEFSQDDPNHLPEHLITVCRFEEDEFRLFNYTKSRQKSSWFCTEIVLDSMEEAIDQIHLAIYGPKVDG